MGVLPVNGDSSGKPRPARTAGSLTHSRPSATTGTSDAPPAQNLVKAFKFWYREPSLPRFSHDSNPVRLKKVMPRVL